MHAGGGDVRGAGDGGGDGGADFSRPETSVHDRAVELSSAGGRDTYAAETDRGAATESGVAAEWMSVRRAMREKPGVGDSREVYGEASGGVYN